MATRNSSNGRTGLALVAVALLFFLAILLKTWLVGR